VVAVWSGRLSPLARGRVGRRAGLGEAGALVSGPNAGDRQVGNVEAKSGPSESGRGAGPGPIVGDV
jgi:hypothetical protein